MSLVEKFREIEDQIAQSCHKAGRKPEEIRLITVTKTHPRETVQQVIDLGYPDIGENRVQEILEKVPLLSGNKVVHLVGHLQSNKVNKVVPLVDWIHSIDSEKILDRVAQQCEQLNKKVSVLIQVNTSHEETKSGCAPEEAFALCEKAARNRWLLFRGLMCIGPLGGDEAAIRKSFITLRTIGRECKQLTGQPFELSMGMSDDFSIAIEEGSTMVRIGSRILGQRGP